MDDQPNRGTGSEMPFTPQVRGLDGGLAKACLSTDGLTQMYTEAFAEGWNYLSDSVIFQPDATSSSLSSAA